MKPCKADRKKFDLDLQYGEVREERVAYGRRQVTSALSMSLGASHLALKLLSQTTGFTTFALVMMNIVH